MELDRQQRNAVYRAVEAGGFPMKEFALTYDPNYPRGLTGITHKSSNSWLSINPNQIGSTWVITWQIQDGHDHSYQQFPEISWPDALSLVTRWVIEVKSIGSVPDLWLDLEQSRDTAETIDHEDVSNDRFTAWELAEIARSFEEIKSQVREIPELTAGQIEGIEQKLDELKEAGKRVGKKDWLVMLYGTAFGLVVNDAVPGHVVQTIISMVAHGVAHIFGVGAPPPTLPPG